VSDISGNMALTEEHFVTLGKVTAVFGIIDQYLDLLIMRLSGCNNVGLEALIGRATFGVKVQMLKDMNASQHFRSANTYEPIRALCVLLGSITPRRNIAVHGRWGTMQSVVRSDASGRIIQDGTAVPAALNNGRRLLASDLALLLSEAEAAAKLANEAAMSVGYPNSIDGQFIFSDPKLRI
jgi:hypothetical protein